MPQQTTRITVIGAGIMGASAAWNLSKADYRVTLVEQYELGHRHGSSHGESRIFRLAYNDADYIPIAQRALRLWRRAEADLDRELLDTTGGLDFGPPHHIDLIAGHLTAAGISFERLSRDESRQRYPAYTLPAGWEALYQPDGGVLYADLCRDGLIELAIRAGTEVRPNTKVRRLVPNGESVTLETVCGQWKADYVVVTAGAWANQLLEPLGLGIPIRVTREHVAHFEYREDTVVLPFRWPSEPLRIYGLPNGRRHTIKVAQNAAGPEVDPDAEERVEPDRVRPVQQFVRDHIPAARPDPVGIETCLYASTPDDDFVIDRDGPIILGVGFGGHGYKFGAAIGEILMDVIEEKPIPMRDRFRQSRFTVTTSPVRS